MTNGGRVLGVTAKGANLKEARKMPTQRQNGYSLKTNISVMISEKR